MLPADMTVKESHHLGLSLQQRIEIFEEVDFTGLHGEDVEGAAEAAAAIKRHKVSCYLNIAACQLKLKGTPSL